MDEFSQYRRLIMSEISTIKNEFSEFKRHVNDSLSNIKISIAVLSTKLLTISTIGTIVVGSAVSFFIDKILK